MDVPYAGKVWVIIPAYQAQGSIGPLAGQIVAQGLPVLVVDDASSDATAEEARKAGAAVLVRDHNGGKGRALQDGFRYALGHGCEWVLTMDSDGQHLTSEIPLFLAASHQAPGQLIVGNRMHLPRGMPLDRWLTNRFMSWLLSLLARTQIPDTQCGFRMIPRGLLEKITLSSDRFEIESEMVLKSIWAGFQVASIPISSVYSGRHLSFIRPLQDTLRFIAMLWRTRRPR